MKATRQMLFAFGTMASILCGGFAWEFYRSHVIATARRVAVVRKVEADDRLSPLQRFAWKTLADHLPPPEPREFSAWEKDWKTKVDVGLEQTSDPDTFSTTQLGKQENPLDPLFRNSFRSVIQFDLNEVASSDRKDALSRKSPQFASVLFNLEAYRSILKAMPKLKSRGEGPVFDENSIIAKAIWTLIPIKNGNSTDAQLEVSNIQSSVDEQYEPGKYGVKQFIPWPGQSHDADHFWTGYGLSTTEPVLDNGACIPTTGRAIPMNCLFSFNLDVSPKNFPVVSKVVRDAKLQANNRFAINGQCGHGDHCVVALMGIHFMVRLRDKDPLIATGASHWVFMTFWWTGKENGRGLPAPWKYYQMNATQTPRMDDAFGGATNVCFNPYLESVLPPAGAVTNCVSCHQYAAYNFSDPSNSKAQNGVGPCLGGKGIGDSITPPGGCEKIRSEYFAGAVRTDFVWSLAGHPPSAPPQTAVSNPQLRH